MKKTFLATIFFVTILILSVPAFALPSGYWTFEEGSADAVASDANSILDSYSTNHGTPSGSDGPVYRSDVPSGSGSSLSLEFDGTDDHAAMTDASSEGNFDIANKLTMAAWVNYGAYTGQYGTILSKGTGASIHGGFFMFVDDYGEIEVAVYGPSDGSWILKYADRPSGWFHVVGVFDKDEPVNNDRLKLYINGIETGSVAGVYTVSSIGLNNCNVMIGSIYDGSQNFDGKVDNVAIWPEALSASEADILYNVYGGDVITFESSGRAIPEPASMLFALVGLGFAVKRRFRT